MNPVKGKIFQPFGQKWIADKDFILNGLQVVKGDDVYQKFFNLAGHNGLDYFAALGEPIVAAFDGFIIEQVAKPTGYGIRLSQRVEIDGKFYMAVYGHLQRLENNIDIPWNYAERSYPVKEGQVIGYVNSTGFSSGNHLHFGMYATNQNGGYLEPLNGYGGCIDPVPLITKGQKMGNAKLINIQGTLGYWFPATTPDGLKSHALNIGEVLPEKADGSIDFDKVKADYEIK